MRRIVNNLAMKQFSNFELLLGVGMLVFAIGFNLWLYRLEPTALVDPNDNTFQFALVHRTDQIWDFAQQNCSPFSVLCYLSYLTDHWVPNWAQGYNLPHYYSHVPQIVIVALWRTSSWFLSLFSVHCSLFTFYHWLMYLLLSLFPVSLFLALSVIGVSPVIAGIGALLSTHLSTDGLYGLDPSSFLWRGYGLSSQLYAMMFLPLTLAFAHKLTTDNKQHTTKTSTLLLTILTLAATTAGHLGIGIIAFLSVGVISLSYVRNFRRLLLIYGGALLLLGYWILPVLLYGNYHNNSVWDPIWKFDSYGFRTVLTNLFNGNLFDFGRFPILTALVFIGMFASLRPHKDKHNHRFAFGLLFIFWLLMYFGTTTWGSLLYLIPGMRDFHLSRFIVGVHISGLFLIPLGFQEIWKLLHCFNVKLFKKKSAITQFSNLAMVEKSLYYGTAFIISFALIVVTYPQTIRYSQHNDTLIKQANNNYISQREDVDALLSALSSLITNQPGRVLAGRGGTWGKDLLVAETPYYMHLSTYGIPTVLWLPETWSPNSDTEQYFREDKQEDYALYNIRYVVTPPDLPELQIQEFWRLIEESEAWNLYEVSSSEKNKNDENNNLTIQQFNNVTMGYITTGVRPAIVSSSKDNFLNVVRLWIQSDAHKNGLFPEFTFDPDYPKQTGLPNFRMTDEVTYRVPDGTRHNLFSEVPHYVSPLSDLSILSDLRVISQKNESDMIFRATIEIPINCTECIVILRQTYHPSWKATIDGKSIETFAVFPFYTAIQIDTPGAHEVIFSYQPSTLKQVLMLISLSTLVFIGFRGVRSIQKRTK